MNIFAPNMIHSLTGEEAPTVNSFETFKILLMILVVFANQDQLKVMSAKVQIILKILKTLASFMAMIF
jgi:hypothetical protein